MESYLVKFQGQIKFCTQHRKSIFLLSSWLFYSTNSKEQNTGICYKLPSSTGFRQPTYNSAVAADYDEDSRWDRKGDQDLHAVVQDQVTKVVVAGDLQTMTM